ncbi:MAG: NrdH-redoxin [Parcubacteria group bacterium 21-54-25]|nr:MAG: NrdH-redoxin [Parcubacteria group bacterium 21-54-25]HQU08129.1 glutaredoxin domain-containing protein [Candidatus Paceibacterota bacterium]
MDKKVTIYSTPTCHFCQLSKEFFKAHDIAFTDHDVATDIAKRREMVERSGQMGVPVIFIDDEMVIGFDQQKLSSLLGVS